jgi:hypothetical protein
MLHHVEDTAALLRATNAALVPGGRIAMADLDAEDGTFHDPAAEGIHHHGFPRETLRQLAADAGLDGAAFEACLSSDAAINAVQADLKTVNDLGLPGTPSFVINGKVTQTPATIGEWRKLLDGLLK